MEVEKEEEVGYYVSNKGIIVTLTKWPSPAKDFFFTEGAGFFFFEINYFLWTKGANFSSERAQPLCYPENLPIRRFRLFKFSELIQFTFKQVFWEVSDTFISCKISEWKSTGRVFLAMNPRRVYVIRAQRNQHNDNKKMYWKHV